MFENYSGQPGAYHTDETTIIRFGCGFLHCEGQ